MKKIFKGYNHWLYGLTQRPVHQLVLYLTTLILLFHAIEDWRWTMVPEKSLAIAMAFYPNLFLRRWAWLAMSGCLIFHNVWHWSSLVNHDYLYTYWVLACTVAICSAKPTKVLGWNARWLIGICFFFATFWKLWGGEYLDGSFLHLTFLLDHRLAMGAVWLGGLDLDTLANNRQLFQTLQSGNGELQQLSTTARMAGVSWALSYWTILIEGLVALSFLSKFPQWLHQKRDWLLLGFVITTYSMIPVLGFGAMLAVMGYAQAKTPIIGRIYLGVLFLMPLWMPLPQLIFRAVQSL